MKPSVALDLQQTALHEALGRFGAANPRVFGSVVHGTDHPGTTLFDLGGLRIEPESLLGGHVDLLTPADSPSRFRAQVPAEAQSV